MEHGARNMEHPMVDVMCFMLRVEAGIDKPGFEW